jgi:hypothetical protein
MLRSLADRGWTIRVVRAIRQGKDPASGRRIVADSLPHGVAGILRTSVLEGIRATIAGGAFPSPSSS